MDVFLPFFNRVNCVQDKCKEYLIILLYCASSVSPGFLAKDVFEFAFLHAINLVEAGRTVEDKRIGVCRH
jgi:AP-4 complex subunit epsilon-1